MAKIRQNSRNKGNNGSKSHWAPGSSYLYVRYHMSIFLMHNYLRLIPEYLNILNIQISDFIQILKSEEIKQTPCTGKCTPNEHGTPNGQKAKSVKKSCLVTVGWK